MNLDIRVYFGWWSAKLGLARKPLVSFEHLYIRTAVLYTQIASSLIVYRDTKPSDNGSAKSNVVLIRRMYLTHSELWITYNLKVKTFPGKANVNISTNNSLHAMFGYKILKETSDLEMAFINLQCIL